MEGQRVAKGGGGKKAGLIVGALAAVAAAGYLGLCAWASEQDAILPNVSVAGVDVSNMIVEQAQDAVESAVEQGSKNITFSLEYEGLSETINGGDVGVDVAESVKNAQRIGHENFFTGGFQLVSHMLGASSQVPLVIAGDDPAVTGLVDRMKEAVASREENHAYKIEGDQLVMTKGAPVVTVDWESAEEQVQSNLQSAFETGLAAGTEPVNYGVVLSATQTAEGEEPDFKAIYEELHTEPKDAALNLETMEISDHTVGVDFDVTELQTAYRNAKGGETFSIPVTLTQPKVTKEDLGGALFRDLLGEATSQVTGVASRLYNVTLSANSCNGKIVLPGEVFSYNDTTGSRSVDKGYLNAPVYKAGESVDDIGGGICQTSSTIYYAVLHTNLEVVERHCHQFNTGYVDLGMDATVYYGSLDFRFKNSTKYPIKIVTESYDSNGARYLTVKIYGTNPEGIYAVPKSSVFDKVSPTTVYKPKDGVAQGSLVLDKEQYAYTGWSAHTYRYIYDKDGNELEKQDMGGSKYKMRPNTYFYNPADGDPSTWVNGKPPAPEQPSTPEAPANPDTPEAPDPATPEPEEPDVTVPPPGVELDLNPI